MKEVTEREFQKECEEFVRRESPICQSALVDNLLQRGVFNWEDISNLTSEDEEQDKEIYEANQS